VKPREQPIVGRRVRRQTELRRDRPVRTLDEFLDFLRRVRSTFGPTNTPRRRTTGDHFRL
jgi:hypothetical protein